MDEICKALSEGIRLKIVFLLTHSELCVCEIQDIFELPQSTVSRHMKYLKDRGLAVSEQRGKWVYYRLAPAKNEFHRLIIEAVSNGLKDEIDFNGLIEKLHHHKSCFEC
jgi:DNA-binding transcriptional ArsR family regulator